MRAAYPLPALGQVAPEADVVVEDAGVDTIGRSVPWLLGELERRGVALQRKSDLGKAFALLEDFGGKARRNDLIRFANTDERVDYLYRAYGADFMTKLLQRGVESGLGGGFDSKFRDLASRDPLPTAPGASAEGRNGLWELALAAACTTFAEDVASAEPDVVMVFRGQRVGLAAKLVYSWEPSRNVDQIIEGAKQIELSDVDVGFVVLNLIQMFPAPSVLRALERIGVESPATAVELVDAWARVFFNRLSMASLSGRLRDRGKVLSVISLIPALVPFGGAPRIVYRISTTAISGRKDLARPFEFALNDSFQRVHFFSGKPGK